MNKRVLELGLAQMKGEDAVKYLEDMAEHFNKILNTLAEEGGVGVRFETSVISTDG